jgi:hypothetical protein
VYEQLNKALMFYIPSIATYWDSNTACQIESESSNLGKYYLDFSSKYYYPDNFSGEGIPLFKVNSALDVYQPTVICQYALGIYELLERKRLDDRDLAKKFFTQADWLIKNKSALNHGVGWKLNFDISDYELKSPWISALTQGEAISVLCRAYKLSGKEIYLKAAESAMEPFLFDVSEGGVKNYFREIPVYEEYPSTRANVVLNGFIFSLFGIYDLYLTNNSTLAKEIFVQGIRSLLSLLAYFDTGIWSLYNLYRFPGKYLASYKYHRLHIEQLKALYILTSETVFHDYYNRWRLYSKSFRNRTKVLLLKLK